MDQKWTHKQLDPIEVLKYVKSMGAPTTSEIKTHFATSSDSVRRVCGRLMAAGKLVPIGGWGGAVHYIFPPKKKGRPNIQRIRAAAKSTQSPEPKQVMIPVGRVSLSEANRRARGE